MTSSRPYLIRALGEWIVDNNLTPYIMVDALVEGAQVPTQFVKDGKIVLNIGPYAVQDLDVSNECVHFFARFNGISTEVLVPIRAVLAIYAKENGQGMVFVDPDSPAPDPQSPDSSSNQGKSGSKPNLKLVK
ncbi:MAG: ClpXP protease specificity-enhancing factor [Gammaproteobacteria bacterium]|nr:ClpXP protease specificity-enhancing factor [Gammaproteobacteria bacterium]